MPGNIPAQMTAKIVIASAARLIPVRQCWRNKNRIAEIQGVISIDIMAKFVARIPSAQAREGAAHLSARVSDSGGTDGVFSHDDPAGAVDARQADH